MMEIKKMFNPESIAVVGASAEGGKIGNVLMKNLVDLGYAGKIFPVNPKHEVLFGRTCYASLENIEDKIDMAIIALPAKMVLPIIEKASQKVKNFVVISAGFSEVGKEGGEREEALFDLAKEKNLNILGPNCLGFIIPRIKLNASFAGGLPQAGGIAFVSQSGALAVAMMDIARKENLRFSGIFSVGNKMQLDEADFLEYLAEDENTKVIGMYLEGIKNGRKFLKKAQAVSRIKPIVVLKAGKTEKAQKAISSHTGSLAGSDEITSAALERAGVIRARDLEDFFSLVELMSFSEAPENDQVVIVTNAGGPGVLTTDAFKEKNITLEELSIERKAALRAFLPEEGSVENPVDLLGDAMDDRYAKAFLELEKGESDTLVCILTPQDQTPVDKIAEEIIRYKQISNKKVITVFIGGERVEKEIKKLKENGIVNFSYPDQAIRALDIFRNWKKDSQKKEARKEFFPNEGRRQVIENILQQAKGEGRDALLFAEAQEVMEKHGITTPYTKNILSGEALPEVVDFPVVMKVNSDKVLHKTDKQGLILDIGNQEELEKAYMILQENFPGERFIIQKMLEIKNEIILGIKQDAVFGPVVVFGLGGIYTEVFKAVNFLIAPSSVEEIKNEIKKSRINFLFKETRGQKPCNIDEFSRLLFSLHALAQENEQIKELDINPLFIYNDGRSAVAVDVKIII